ncbi:hypothetical protein CRG98_038755 [Punica granatum]|uniref:Uncharacterized protein n=1 Tax=Punica granatum TaxID=22663 RepID=A0A2I0IA20_PUNGR|nr:hypothetical protein CRG98_038755 [Punica granatum]
MQAPDEIDECSRGDVIDRESGERFKETYSVEALETAIMEVSKREEDELMEMVNFLDATPYLNNPIPQYEPLERPISMAKRSIKEPPKLELKPLPEHLRYIFIGDSSTLPVIISTHLTNGL